jgi:hypothetical protein
MISLLCECDDDKCSIRADVPLDDAAEFAKRGDLIIIVDGCEHGPEADDELESAREGYNLYRIGGKK